MQGFELMQFVTQKHPEVTLIAVTKSIDADRIRELLDTDLIHHIGESRIKDAIGKFKRLWDLTFQKHYLGHIQTRQVKDVVKHFDVIHSVDSLELAQRIDRYAKRAKKKQKILLQLNLTREAQKYGFTFEENIELDSIVAEIQKFENLDLIGLMCFGRQNDLPTTRYVFKQLRKLASSYGLKECSMGMSDDYMSAIDAGSTMLRIGRRILSEDAPIGDSPDFDQD